MKEDSIMPQKHVFARKGKRYERICIEDVLWVEASGSSSILVKRDEKYVISTNLGKMQEQLPKETLVRVQRSFLVNINKIKAFDDTNIYLTMNGDEKAIPIGKSYRKKLLSKLQRLRTE